VKNENPITGSLNEKLKMSAKIDIEMKSAQRENLLIYAAMDQFLYENNVVVADSEDRTRQVISMLLSRSQNIVESTFSNEEEVVFADL